MDERFRVRNDTRSTVLAERGSRATSYWQRFRGLMLTEDLPVGSALVLEPCASIHMFFMRYPIDVIFLSPESTVVGLVECIRPWRMTRFYRGARCAVELPCGVIHHSATQAGDTLVFEPVGRA